MRAPSLLLFLISLFATVAARAEVITTEVCVYGANSGGVIAAVQATRMGKSAVLLATNTHVGGMSSGGLGATDFVRPASIGGLADEFYRRIGARLGIAGARYFFPPHLAEEEFRGLLTDAGVLLRTGQRIASVTKSGQRIVEIAMEDGTIYRAGMFIDASYEGDLMALAGVSWTIGRESNATYNETINGATPSSTAHQFLVNVDPYVTPGDPTSGLLPLVGSGTEGTPGAGDGLVQAYNYRLCLTANPGNRLPIPAPPGYDESRYELLGRWIEARLAAGQTPTLGNFMYLAQIGGGKTDVNNNGPISTDFIGGNTGYATASHAQREVIARDHLEYIQGFLYYLGHSERVPAGVRAEMLNWGPCADEFLDTAGWPHQLYVRESRRMIADYVMTERDCNGLRTPADSVGLGEYYMDSHFVQRLVKNGAVWNEGITGGTVPQPYPISYRSIVPRVGECENLLVPWALSASHAAFTSIRMEPVFMILAQSAATAAAFALDDGVPVQQVDYAKLALQLRAHGQVLATSGGATPTTGSAPDTIVDNTDPGVTVTGAWTTSTATPGFLGANYFHDGNTGKGTKSVLFTPSLPVPGTYDVYLRWTAANNRATNVPVDVNYLGGTSSSFQNEQNNNGTWVLLNTAGPLTFAAGTGGSVRIRTDNSDGYVVADAVRFALRQQLTSIVQIVATDSVAREAAPADTARWTVFRDAGQTTNAVVVPYTLSGTAGPGDYTALSGSVTIPAGQIAATIQVAAVPNSLAEGDRTLTLTLLPDAGLIIGPSASATIRIVDKPTVQIFTTDAIAREDDPADTARFTVVRDPGQTAQAWTVAYALGGTATAGADYALPGSVIIPAGQSAATIELAALPDALVEGAETVTLTLLPGVEFNVGASGTASATILDRAIDGWRFAHFTAEELADPAISGDAADPDHDGIANLMEYALGLGPLAPDGPVTTLAVDDTGHLTLSFRRWREATGVTVAVEGSTDVLPWASDASMVEEISRVADGAFDVITVRLVPQDSPSGFLRLRVSRQ